MVVSSSNRVLEVSLSTQNWGRDFKRYSWQARGLVKGVLKRPRRPFKRPVLDGHVPRAQVSHSEVEEEGGSQRAGNTRDGKQRWTGAAFHLS